MSGKTSKPTKTSSVNILRLPSAAAAKKSEDAKDKPYDAEIPFSQHDGVEDAMASYRSPPRKISDLQPVPAAPKAERVLADQKNISAARGRGLFLLGKLVFILYISSIT